MNIFFKVIIFSLLTMGIYTLFATNYIPPMNSAPVPAEETIDLAQMTIQQFIALGDKIFHGKGTCTLCHNPVVKRAPLLDGVAGRIGERLKDTRYKGGAKDLAGYIEESMRKPSAYVVAGYGVTGSNDTVSPMPVISEGAIGLNDVEIKAVIAYLQNLGGAEVTVEIPKGPPMAEGKDSAQAATLPAKTGAEIVKKFGCGLCHKIAGEQGAIGPDLTKIGAKKNADYLRRAVFDPNADIAPGFPPGMMPQDFKDKMTAGELQVIVDYLAKSK
ncbi:MAG: c-type cytochrome [Deltaproteobacteria bacterium]|nr:c-type cytochrome [Deltaproteobacteria bacterium]